MKKVKRSVVLVKEEIRSLAERMDNDRDAAVGSRLLALYVERMRQLLKELLSCEE